ncbi:hypothetical protein [Chitinophaga sp. S165]|uniref:hypothetical protein n=1 Tax=Chitinophaga sp. S165 TaxID=2135462 RepID=UPI000D712617|nr:hypothetical protein [Chitinophaga sp. S165]PWV55630.1 hypothetical protein C7475_101136 [Chitinophaga sp. S165]
MARQNSLIPFTGKLGNLIGYCRNGKYFLRSMPEIVRQTVATRRSALRFGIASKKGALIRSVICPELDVCYDNGYVNRLTRALIPATGNKKRLLEGFRFNQYTGTDQFFTVPPVVSANGILQVPEQTLPRLKGMDAVELKVIASCIDFTRQQVLSTQVITAILDPRQPFTGMTLPMEIPGSGTLVVTLQVRCIQHGCPSGDRRYQAADIIAVIEPQTAPVVHQPVYERRKIKQAEKTVYNAAYGYVPVPVILRE